jgi:hypothetical protein
MTDGAHDDVAIQVLAQAGDRSAAGGYERFRSVDCGTVMSES